MNGARRGFLRSLCRTALVFSFEQIANSLHADGSPLGVRFVNVAREAGIRTKTIFGGENRNRYLLETTGCGVAIVDFDHDGWLDIFLVNGNRFETKFDTASAPTNRLFKNNRDGTFTDVTVKAGLVRTGWGQACCVGDYDNDGYDDLFVTYWGDCALYHNNGDGTFTDVARQAGVTTAGGKLPRWNTGCAFVDYDRDGNLDLFVANYIDFDVKTVPTPENGTCLYKGLKVACGPPGLNGGKNILFHNNGKGAFTDVSKKSGILDTSGTYGLGVLVADFDNDGWPDIYVANDSTSSALYKNNHDGTFSEIAIEAGVAYGADGKSQAGMGVSAA
ncbi:MAG: ASPIC/UnbV domain protein, partial [Bryobacterales bacterium]|nr:ASPIC/UnbV domain protein [Bryobacterales bacterium]